MTKSARIYELLETAESGASAAKKIRLVTEALQLRPSRVDAVTAYLILADALKEQGKHAKAVEAQQAALERAVPGEDVRTTRYNLACYLALARRKTEMLEALHQAIKLDRTYGKKAESDPDFTRYRQDEQFLAVCRAGRANREALEERLAASAADASRVILSIGKSLPVDEVDWDVQGDGIDLTVAMEQHGGTLDTKALLHVLALILDLDTPVRQPILFEVIWRHLKPRAEERLCMLWLRRYRNMDACHMSNLDAAVVHAIAGCEPVLAAKTFLRGIAHLPESYEDYAPALGRLRRRLRRTNNAEHRRLDRALSAQRSRS